VGCRLEGLMAHLKLFTDGACRGNPGEAAIGLVLKDENGKTLATRHRYLGHTTNNVAEYRGLIDGLQLVKEFAPSALDIYMDSKLVVEQVNNRWRVKDENLRELWAEAQKLIEGLTQVQVQYVPREKNGEADALANQALDEQRAKERRG
jgi:ribonuclease HI